jgi:hypothetical protein
MALRNNAVCKATRSFVAGLGSLQKDKVHSAAYVASGKLASYTVDPVWMRLE